MRNAGWDVVDEPTTQDYGIRHCIPTDDWMEHDVSVLCNCSPKTQEIVGGYIVVHHSLDGRERDEQPKYLALRMDFVPVFAAGLLALGGAAGALLRRRR